MRLFMRDWEHRAQHDMIATSCESHDLPGPGQFLRQLVERQSSISTANSCLFSLSMSYQLTRSLPDNLLCSAISVCRGPGRKRRY